MHKIIFIEKFKYCEGCTVKMSITHFIKNDVYCKICLKYMG